MADKFENISSTSSSIKAPHIATPSGIQHLISCKQELLSSISQWLPFVQPPSPDLTRPRIIQSGSEGGWGSPSIDPTSRVHYQLATMKTASTFGKSRYIIRVLFFFGRVKSKLLGGCWFTFPLVVVLEILRRRSDSNLHDNT